MATNRNYEERLNRFIEDILEDIHLLATNLFEADLQYKFKEGESLFVHITNRLTKVLFIELDENQVWISTEFGLISANELWAYDLVQIYNKLDGIMNQNKQFTIHYSVRGKYEFVAEGQLNIYATNPTEALNKAEERMRECVNDIQHIELHIM